MTEEEAKTKWCPHVRFQPVKDGKASGATGNRHGDSSYTSCNPESCRCIASECMMWRSEYIGVHKSVKGFCGLAGKP